MAQSRLQMHGIVFFLLASLALASRFKFIVQSVDVGVTRDMQEDDLILAIGTKTNSGTTNSTWALGSVVEGDSIKWDNLTTEIEVPATGSNLSIGIGILNAEATDDKVNATAQFVQGILEIAEKVPGTVGTVVSVFNTFMDAFGDWLSCDGEVFLDNPVYAEGELNGFEQYQNKCTTQNYTFDPGFPCRVDRNTSYSVTYCIERLDAKEVPPQETPKAKSGAVNLLPGFLFGAVSLSFALFYGL